MRVTESQREVKTSEKCGGPSIGHNTRVRGKDLTKQGATRPFNALFRKRCRT
jgi:hypothetical protein